MCFEAKRLFRLALGPVLMLMSAATMAAGGEVSSFNMSPGVTAVGKEIYEPAHDHLLDLHDHRRWRFWGDVLFHLCPP